MELSSVEAAIDAIAKGEIIVVVDDDDRENEGDLVMAATMATPEKVAFIIRNSCGILCTPLTPEDAVRLQLGPMVPVNDAPLGTAFTVSVDYRVGTTTGISAEDRCATTRALANGNVGAGDFARPGHVFPLVAKPGGVLMRSGHTEAAVDLARLAGLAPVGLICELVNDDGTVKRGSQVGAFAKQHDLKLISVADLIAYRQRREQLVERIAENPIQTKIGEARGLAFATPFDDVHHLALVFGDIGDGKNIVTRLHREDVVDDVFGAGDAVDSALQCIAREGRGVLIYLREGASGVPVMAFAGDGTASTNERQQEWRDIGLGAQILRDLRIRSIRLVTNTSRHYVGLNGFGIEILSTEPGGKEE